MEKEVLGPPQGNLSRWRLLSRDVVVLGSKRSPDAADCGPKAVVLLPRSDQS